MRDLRGLLSAAWLALLLLPGPHAHAGASVSLRAEAVVVGDRILAGEIAEVSGGDAASVELKRRLDQISLGPSPRPGMSRVLSQGTVDTRLRASLGEAELAMIAIPERIEVSRAATWIAVEEVRQAVEGWIAAELALPGAEIAVAELSPASPIPIPVGAYRLELSQGSGAPLGSTTVSLSVWQQGTEIVRQRLAVDVRVRAPVVVLARAVPRGAALESRDLSTAVRALDHLPAMPVTAAEDALGMQTRRALGPGDILTEDAVVLPDDVQEGEAITVWIRTGAVTVSAPGEARADGRIGDTIPVLCEATGKVLKARIVARGEVELAYAPAGR